MFGEKIRTHSGIFGGVRNSLIQRYQASTEMQGEPPVIKRRNYKAYIAFRPLGFFSCEYYLPQKL